MRLCLFIAASACHQLPFFDAAAVAAEAGGTDPGDAIGLVAAAAGHRRAEGRARLGPRRVDAGRVVHRLAVQTGHNLFEASGSATIQAGRLACTTLLDILRLFSHEVFVPTSHGQNLGFARYFSNDGNFVSA